MAALPPAPRTIDAAQARAGRVYRMIQQPGEVLDYALDFTRLLPAGATSFTVAGVTYGIGAAGAAPATNGLMAIVYVDTDNLNPPIDGVIMVEVSARDAANTLIVARSEFTIACRDQ